ncbi:MAG: ORF6N domain-containing protein [Candidatus Omnitrophica bacterium]|nr:ORF6N domain-containing protein [Candidatus Omnitrophota bacterium]
MISQNKNAALSVEIVGSKILVIRGKRVMLDRDLADLYGVETKRLNEQIKRNSKRFPIDFMFQLTSDEIEALRSQNATLKKGRGRHTKYLPYVFTEQGVAMLSTVLNSEKAIEVNIQIMRAFVKIREFLATNEALAERVKENREAIIRIFKIIEELRQPVPAPKKKIGFHAEKR